MDRPTLYKIKRLSNTSVFQISLLWSKIIKLVKAKIYSYHLVGRVTGNRQLQLLLLKKRRKKENA